MQPHEDVSDTTRCWMAELCDELLLEILSRVSCSATLLDAVPLVCKRWRALAADPRAWAGAAVYVECYLDKGKEVVVPADAARLLLHAPAISCLSFALDFLEEDESSLTATAHALASCLRRCTGRVRAVHLGGDIWDVKPLHRALLDLLHRSRDHLKELSGLPVLYDAVSSRIIRDLRHLEDLMILDLAEVEYAGELSSGVPPLRDLTFEWHGDPGDLNPDLLGDLLAGASRSLRSATISMNGQAWPALVVERLANCVGLRSLTGDLQCVAALRDMRELRELSLVSRFKDDEVPVVVLPRAGSLPNLRSLRILDLFLDGVGDRGLLGALARAAPNIAHLSVSVHPTGGTSWDAVAGRVGEMMDAMPHLEAVDRLVCGVDFLPKLMAREELKELAVTVLCPPARMAHLDRLVEQWPLKRPNLNLSITVQRVKSS